MIGEGLFIFLPTIIAITIAFFVGLGVGIFLCCSFCICFFMGIHYIPGAKGALQEWVPLKDESNKQTSFHQK